MTTREFEKFIEPLDLSARSFNCLMRCHKGGILYRETSKRKDASDAIRSVEGYKDLQLAIEEHGESILNLGRKSRQEIIDKCEKIIVFNQEEKVKDDEATEHIICEACEEIKSHKTKSFALVVESDSGVRVIFKNLTPYGLFGLSAALQAEALNGLCGTH